jgi:hypothetical protein
MSDRKVSLQGSYVGTICEPKEGMQIPDKKASVRHESALLRRLRNDGAFYIVLCVTNTGEALCKLYHNRVLANYKYYLKWKGIKPRSIVPAIEGEYCILWFLPKEE